MSNGIKVRMIYSACVVIETANCRILCDPWFTDGIYDGSWYLFPIAENPIEVIGDCDFIFISHIHPDHYDPIFIKSYFERYGSKPLLVANRQSNSLAKKAFIDGFEVQVLEDDLQISRTLISIIPHETGSQSDIDSVLIVKHIDDEHVSRVVNINDCIVDQQLLDQISMYGPIDILLLGFTGAGPYPQTYFSLDDPQLLIAGEQKKADFFQRYLNTTGALQSRVNIPFAGQYVLGGKLTKLNQFRGVADATEVLLIDPNAIVLDDYLGSIDTDTMVANHPRTKPHSPLAVENRLKEIASKSMVYESLINEFEANISIEEALEKPLMRARNRSECRTDYFFVFNFGMGSRWIINANSNSLDGPRIVGEFEILTEPRSEVSIDEIYFRGLLSRRFHWNNAEVGSQYFTKRIPDVFNRQAMNFLNFLHV